MATLTEVSVVARKVIRTGIGVVIFLMFLPLIKATAIAIWQRYHPPPPPPPTVKFGRLPVLSFPNIQYPSKPKISLETITGGFPNLGSTAKVYLVEINKSRLLTLDRYKQKAQAINLNPDPIQIDDRRYQFLHQRVQANMIVDLITDQIDYKYDWTRDRGLITPGLLLAPDVEIGEAKNFLNQLGIMQADLSSGTGKVTYYTATGSAFVQTNNYNEATFVRVDLFRDDIDKMKFVTAGGNFSPVNVTFASTQNQDAKVVSASFYYSRLVGKDIFATYPLKGVEKAYAELQNGQGFIVRNVVPNAVVREITLAYYESNTPQDYLQPVYVFAGDGGFLAYVPAVDESMINSGATAAPTIAK